jgi:hypothetical protein
VLDTKPPKYLEMAQGHISLSICAPKKNNTYNDQVYRDKCHKCYYIAEMSYIINDNK